jgi:hypothetical protein
VARSSEHTLEPLSPFTDSRTLELADAVEVDVPRGEPRKLLAAVADALAAREPAATLAEKLNEAAGAVLPEAQADERLAQAFAYRLALPLDLEQWRVRRRLDGVALAVHRQLHCLGHSLPLDGYRNSVAKARTAAAPQQCSPPAWWTQVLAAGIGSRSDALPPRREGALTPRVESAVR